MADDEQNQQPPRYWFPYWSGIPQPPPPSRPPVRPQQSRRLSPPSPAASPSSPRRPSPSQHRQQPAATRGAAAPPCPPQNQVSRPSPSRTSPLAPIRDPAPPANSSNVAPAKLPAKPAVLLLPAVPEAAPGQKDVGVVLPPPKAVVQLPAAVIKPDGHGKAADKEHKPHHHKEKEVKDEHKSKDKDHKEKKDETKSKDKEKEKDHKEKKDESKSKEKEEKEKKHHAGEDGKHKEAKAEHGKLHREIKAGVADMVHKASGAAGSGHAPGSGASVITLAGENKGASMNVGGGKSKNGGEWHGGHGYRLDGGSGSDGKKAAGKAGMMTALINSNVQVINNSLLLQSSCSGGDPGVHLKLSAKSASKDKQKHTGGGDKAAAASAGEK